MGSSGYFQSPRPQISTTYHRLCSTGHWPGHWSLDFPRRYFQHYSLDPSKLPFGDLRKRPAMARPSWQLAAQKQFSESVARSILCAVVCSTGSRRRAGQVTACFSSTWSSVGGADGALSKAVMWKAPARRRDVRVVHGKVKDRRE
jgi:hypothetical protein